MTQLDDYIITKTFLFLDGVTNLEYTSICYKLIIKTSAIRNINLIIKKIFPSLVGITNYKYTSITKNVNLVIKKIFFFLDRVTKS